MWGTLRHGPRFTLMSLGAPIMHKRTIALAAAALLIGGATASQAGPQKQVRAAARDDGRTEAAAKSQKPD